MRCRWVAAVAATLQLAWPFEQDVAHRPDDPSMVFDCKAGAHSWEQSWNKRKKAYCCLSAGFACKPFDCNPHHQNMSAWSKAKATYCCGSVSLGCPAMAAAPSGKENVYDCRLGQEHWDSDWPNSKKDYCCKTTGLACPAYNCSGGQEESWPSDKVVWCCDHMRRGCEQLVDCHKDFEDWETKWLFGKKQYCCKAIGKPCDPYQCNAANPSQWTPHKHQWCCAHGGRGCNPPVEKATINCFGGKADLQWKWSWSEEKLALCCRDDRENCEPFDCASGLATAWTTAQRNWCCMVERKACQPDLEAAGPQSQLRLAQDGQPTESIDNVDCTETDNYNFHNWSYHKQRWCCEKEGTGCRSAFIYDCSARPGEWSPMKRRYCCDKEQKGCDEGPSTDRACDGDEAGLGSGSWSAPHRAWCCREKQIGCFDSLSQVAPELDFHCDLGMDVWDKTWSSAKKSFCCLTNGFACQPFDCSADPATWSATRQTWCCEKESVGCTFDCEAGGDNWEHWSHEQKLYCCQAVGKACDRFQCHDGREALWPLGKTSWCCEQKVIGCQTIAGPPPDCQKAIQDWDITWSKAKKTYCCDRYGVGCVPYDCETDIRQPPSLLTDEKRTWCCLHEGRGCNSTTAVGHEPVDCSAGFDQSDKKLHCCQTEHQADAWTAERKAYCCERVHIGCNKQKGLPFDCTLGLASWETGWAPQKKRWCCEHGGAGCTAVRISTNHANSALTIADLEPQSRGRGETWRAPCWTLVATSALALPAVAAAAALAMLLRPWRRRSPVEDNSTLLALVASDPSRRRAELVV